MTGTAASGAISARSTGRHPHFWRNAIVAVAAIVLVVGTVVAVQYRHQIVSYMTHLKGSPTHTVAYTPFDPAPEFHLAAAGDIGEPGGRLDATGRTMAEIGATTPYDALLLLGDNVYPNGDPAKLPGTVFEPFAPVLAQDTELLAILGNHDVKDGNGPPQMEALGMPGRWWSKDYGDVLLVGLDSNTPEDPDQLRFLEQTLSATDATWKIVALHHPPYSAGYQGSDHAARDTFAPMFERYGVQLVLSGHDHDYQRSKPINGVVYVVSGAGATTRRTGEADFTAVSFSWHHFLDIGVFPDRLVVRAVNQDERVADEFELSPNGQEQP
jgi:3',5'-cyclic AMP phosphodiesterase CpdA